MRAASPCFTHSLQDGRERVGVERVRGVECCASIQPFNGGNHELRDREIGARMFLRVEHADFNRVTVEARDGAARVQPFELQNVVDVVRRDGAEHRLQNHVVILRFGTHRLRNDATGDQGHAR